MGLQYSALKNRTFPVLLFAVCSWGLYYTSTVNYLLFHCIVEFFSIAIALSFFLIAWNVREGISNYSLAYLGISYFFVAILGLAHTLSYKGMHIFNYDYYASELWIAARYMESISLFVFFTLSSSKKRISYETILGIYFCVTCLLLASIYYWKIFPVCFVEGKGQTHFKVYSEYIICAILMLSLFPLFHNRKIFDKTIFRLLCGAVLFSTVSEFFFSLYTNVFGFSNFIGHILKLFSYCLIYKAIIENGLRQPFNLIFKELKEKAELLNLTQQIAKIGGWDYDLAIDKMIWTDEVYRIREIPLEYQADLEQALKFYTENSAQKFRKTFQRLVNEGGSDDLELEMITAKNRKIWVRVTFAAQRENGKTVRVSGIIQDITEHKNTEELRKDFEQITRHDLKTPLNSIFMASQLLDVKRLSMEENKKLVQIIQDSVCNLLDMVNLSLNLFSIEDGAYNLVAVPFDFKDLLGKVIDDHALAKESKKINLLVTVNGKPIDSDTAFLNISGEATLMYSMLSNLYKNAIEASPIGEKVEIKVEEKGEKYTVEIKNKGTVPPELRDKFFNKYATAGKKGGTGLGTYSARLIAELHKGRITMTSSDELGTSIIIELLNDKEHGINTP